MIRIPDHPPLTLLRDFLLNSGYSARRLRDQLGLAHVLSADLSNLATLLERTKGEELLRVLCRLLFVGWPVSAEICRKHIPEPLVQLCLEAHLFISEGADFIPQIIIVPFEDVLLFACDAPRLRGNNPQVVVGPSATTNLVARTLIRSRAETLLDVGTGTGVLAVCASSFSNHIVATDVNTRAIEFARFNAALNGVHNVRFLPGDAFQPVQGRRFSRIVANPPFFITPQRKLMHSDSPLELDGFSRKLAMEAPDYLEDGGVFHMMCEWVEVEGEPWQERLRSWTSGRGCDVLVFASPGSKPIDYVERRYDEIKSLNTESSETLLSEYMLYFRRHRVREIRNGILTMRRRKGSNWFSGVAGDEIDLNSAEVIQQRIDALTMLAECTDGQLLQSRFYFTPDTRVLHTQRFNGRQWELNRVEISKPNGIGDNLQVDSAVLPTIELFDGRNTVAAIADKLAQALSIGIEESTTRCLALTKRLAASSFILPVTPDRAVFEVERQ